jgi:hypothetical protein
MSTIDFIRGSLRQLHAWYDDAIAGLTPEQMHWTANERGTPIAFVLWHYVRTEDNIIQFVLQRKKTVWIEEGYDEKFGLDRVAQGTGMSLEEARALRIRSTDGWPAYQGAVWRATEAFLASMTDESLQEKTTVKPLGEMPVLNAIGNMCVTHGYMHLGEIAHLRGLLGLRGMGW